MITVSIIAVGLSSLTALFLIYLLDGFFSHFNKDSPLYLTPLLEDNKILEAQLRSRVKPDIANSTCFTGFFTVKRECESNLFFWFCQSQANWEKSPVILWLQGGPGASSLFGLFKEIGPFDYKDGVAIKRDLSWNRNNNLLFIDQPVGTGFSFTGMGCYAKNKHDIAKDLYSAITQFYQLFPNLRSNQFYIAGESYAGHYIPYIGHYIHKMNPTEKYKIKLGGMMIGNGWMDPYLQYDYGEFLYYLGLIDEEHKETLHRYLLEFRNYFNAGDWTNASIATFKIVETNDDALDKIDVYNYLQDSKSAPSYDDFVDFSLLRKSINVGSQTFGDYSYDVYSNLVLNHVYDEIQSVKAEVEELLEHYPIIFYFGQLDAMCPYSVALGFLRELQWSGADNYRKARRCHWCVDGQLAGLYRTSHNLHEVLVRNAGHSVPLQQPLRAYLLADSVTSSPSGYPLQKLTLC